MRFAALANRFGRSFRHLIVAMDGRTKCRERLGTGLDVAFCEIDLQPNDTFGNMRRFGRLLRKTAPDRLITYNWGSIECAMANWLVRVPHIHIEDGFGPEEAKRQLRRRVLTRRVVLSRSTVVLPSRTLYRLACDVWKLNPSRLRHVPNGIDSDRFGMRRAAPFPCAGTGPVIGTVAVLRPEKNFLRLLHAFRDVHSKMPCRLLIAGEGTMRTMLEHSASMLGLDMDVTFAGHVNETERVYAALSVYALSSDTEQMPVSVLEAMAAGLPVASTDVGDVREMVAEENGPFITPLDSGALADAMRKLLSAPEQAAQIGAANRAAVKERYDQERMFAAYEALFSGSG